MLHRFFGLPLELYDGKRVLDLGCGPRGSLEWAERAAERVGLDPLADEYQRLHSREHAMTYVAAPAEAIPFPDSHFDVVSTIQLAGPCGRSGRGDRRADAGHPATADWR